MSRIIITGKSHPFLPDHLRQQGFEVVYLPAITYDELSSSIHEAEGIVVTTRVIIDKTIIDKERFPSEKDNDTESR